METIFEYPDSVRGHVCFRCGYVEQRDASDADAETVECALVPFHYRPRAKYKEEDRWMLLEVPLCRGCGGSGKTTSDWSLTGEQIEALSTQTGYLVGWDWWDAIDGLDAHLR